MCICAETLGTLRPQAFVAPSYPPPHHTTHTHTPWVQNAFLLAFFKSKDPQSQQMTLGVHPDLIPLAQDTAVEKWLRAQAFKKKMCLVSRPEWAGFRALKRGLEQILLTPLDFPPHIREGSILSS